MAKSASTRLDSELLEYAADAGRINHRSTANQVEHWASLGRVLERVVGMQAVLDILAGTKRIELKSTDIPQPTIDPSAIFAELDSKREALSHQLKKRNYYRPSRSHAGLLERVEPDGTFVTGQFEDGAFQPAKG